MADVFISHSSADREVAEILYNQLEAKGISCWISSKDITPGEDWAKSINDAITKSSIFLIIFSKHSVQSTQVPREIGLAGTRNLCIIPYKIDDTQLEGEFEYYLSSSHWITADIAKKDYKINELCSAISLALNKAKTPSSSNTYINTMNITEIKDNKIAYVPVNFKKYTLPIAVAVIMLVLIFIIIGLSRSDDNNISEQKNVTAINDTTINVALPLDETTTTMTNNTDITTGTTAEMPAGNSVTVVPTDLTPYESYAAYYLSNDYERSVTVAGSKYNTAVVLQADSPSNQAMFNVGGEYQKMSFSAGRVDGNNNNDTITVRIWLDGEEANPIKISKSALPQTYEYDISGVKHIKFAADSVFAGPQIAFTDFYLTK